ncbi:MAG: hypothetical protein AAFR56_08060, partial [Chloroflexota bacterium]
TSYSESITGYTLGKTVTIWDNRTERRKARFGIKTRAICLNLSSLLIKGAVCKPPNPRYSSSVR